ncbi:glycosyl hydrolase [[Clostridium] polysaccharolyticum]|uniref:Mannan endo-1,4-beta-mannosidase n=1 Tax=[Clostridium] polysaccharolyticum TaxID=29364 RepID=A0A1H9ZBZ2_9FIRM|nr:glycosyl hydrolase [[Clostridium] polysaccharolyticum]SES78356.1 mannan endo-1,4-beta-mannosidase [[Clostridium] polysaccharolyticum]
MRKNYLYKRIGALMLAATVMGTTVTQNAFSGFVAKAASEQKQEAKVLKAWNFTTGADGWEYGTDWEYEYHGIENSSVSWDEGKLKATVDYSKDADQGWSQMAVKTWGSKTFDLTGANLCSFDFYYDSSCKTQGKFQFKLFSSGAGIEQVVSFDEKDAETVEGTIKKVTVVTDIDLTGEDIASTYDFAICLVGSETDYVGDVWFDNIKLLSAGKQEEPAKEGKVLKSWSYTTGTDGWEYGTNWEYKYDGIKNSSVSWDEGKLKATVDYSKNADEGWSQMAVKTWVNNTMDLTGLNLCTFDFFYDESKMTQGNFMFKLFSNGAGIEQNVTFEPENAETVEGTIKKISLSVDLGELTSEDIAAVNDFAICLVGVNTDYVGDVWFDNIKLISTTAQEKPVNALARYTFDNSAQGWYYGQGWEFNYHSADKSSVKQENGMLRVNCDFSKDAAETWSQLAACVWDNNGLNLTGANQTSLDFIFDRTLLKKGSFKLKLYSNDHIDTTADVDLADAEEVEGTNLIKVPVHFYFEPLTDADKVNDLAVCIIGSSTDYAGPVYLDNVTVMKAGEATSSYVNSTVKATGAKYKQSVKDGVLTTFDKDGSEVKTKLATQVPVVDRKATDAVKQAYAYLKAIGSTDTVIYGHQDDTFAKAGSKDLSTSDTYDVTGAYAGVFGIDALALAGQEYSAYRFNNEIVPKTGAQRVPETLVGNVQASAALTNMAIESGALVTLSAHMPNFSLTKAGNYDGVHSYTKYNFSGYTVNDLTGDTMNQILPGGKYNDKFNAYLDMIAEYANQVDGAIIFRPFHENTGGWFWWGTATCDAETYKNVYRYTVEYLRDTKGVHNMLYEYGPSADAVTVADYEERFPGDEYVDIVGFDCYNNNPKDDDTFVNILKAQLDVTGEFASQHNKLLAVTETGMASTSVDKGDHQTAVHKVGNKDKDWYLKVMETVAKSDASYFLLWANFAENDGFYSPYVKSVNEDGSLYGHELLDNFINFYNDPRSAFTSNMQNAMEQLKDVKIDAIAISDAANGYITSPASGSRILEATDITAKLVNVEAADKVEIVFYGADNVVEKVTAATADGVNYKARLDADTLKALGSTVGTMALLVNGETIQTINATYNIPEPVIDPLVADNFEDYYGVESLLNKAWPMMKYSGCSLNLGLTKEPGKFYEGNYGLKFTYDESADGWAGATIAKDANWSGCNALQLWTIPDGNNQKTVVQITANDKVYEVYLNKYAEYANSTEPMLITIPFSEFCERDTAGNPKGNLPSDSFKISSVGLWVNAIDGTPAVIDGRVTGTIYYDAVKAVKTDKTAITFEKTDAPQPSVAPSVEPSIEPSVAPSVKPSIEPSVAPSVKPSVKPSVAPSVEPTPSVKPEGICPKVKVETSNFGGISQKYTITNGGTKAFDLSKLTVRYNYKKSGNLGQQFWCDNAALALNEAPYYVSLGSSVKGEFKDGYLEISFADAYVMKSGELTLQIRLNQENWASYENFEEGAVEVYYDGQLIK